MFGRIILCALAAGLVPLCAAGGAHSYHGPRTKGPAPVHKSALGPRPSTPGDGCYWDGQWLGDTVLTIPRGDFKGCHPYCLNQQTKIFCNGRRTFYCCGSMCDGVDFFGRPQQCLIGVPEGANYVIPPTCSNPLNAGEQCDVACEPGYSPVRPDRAITCTATDNGAVIGFPIDALCRNTCPDELAAAQTQIEGLQARNQELEAENNELRLEVSNLQELVVSLNDTIEQLEAELAICKDCGAGQGINPDTNTCQPCDELISNCPIETVYQFNATSQTCSCVPMDFQSVEVGAIQNLVNIVGGSVAPMTGPGGATDLGWCWKKTADNDDKIFWRFGPAGLVPSFPPFTGSQIYTTYVVVRLFTETSRGKLTFLSYYNATAILGESSRIGTWTPSSGTGPFLAEEYLLYYNNDPKNIRPDIPAANRVNMGDQSYDSNFAGDVVKNTAINTDSGAKAGEVQVCVSESGQIFQTGGAFYGYDALWKLPANSPDWPA